MEKWFVTAKKADFYGWAKTFEISPVLARIIRNRDITEEAQVKKFLYGTQKDCYSPFLLKDMEKAADFLLQKIKENALIRVIGDYDVDGICSSYILTKGLRVLGALVDTAIPHRIYDGYGLNEHLIEEARKDGVEVILTCDNGIAAAPQIQMAIDYGIAVIVTDHHEVPFIETANGKKEILPPAYAIVDPKQKECSYPFKSICGGVVAYKLVQALWEKTKSKELAEVLEEMLELAALATVCDVMELKDENRILVKEGLKRLQQTKNIGLGALMEVNKINPEKLTAYHLGFVIGPCLNATGRLDSAKRALELLESTNQEEAIRAAEELKSLNDSRKSLTLAGVEQAEEYIQQKGIDKDKVMIVYLPEVHESLAGIIAGRIREKYNHPVFVLTKSEDGVKGSGRSMEAYHMYEHMTAVSSFFSKFGGHKLAAGLSLAFPKEQTIEEKQQEDRLNGINSLDRIEERIEQFREALNKGCELTEEDFIPKVHIDVAMPLSYADIDLAKSMELLEPYGVGNPKPLFAEKNLHFIRGYKMGAKQNFARFYVCTQENIEKEVVFFGDLEKFVMFLDKKYGSGSADKLFMESCDYLISITYQLGINTFHGRENLQFIMQNYC